jgi:hypothetical protein
MGAPLTVLGHEQGGFRSLGIHTPRKPGPIHHQQRRRRQMAPHGCAGQQLDALPRENISFDRTGNRHRPCDDARRNHRGRGDREMMFRDADVPGHVSLDNQIFGRLYAAEDDGGRRDSGNGRGTGRRAHRSIVSHTE